LGEGICSAIKTIFYPDIPWPKCYMQVAKKFSELKAKGIKFYGNKTKFEVVQELTKYSHQDMIDLFDYK
jgi:hypothetical protein